MSAPIVPVDYTFSCDSGPNPGSWRIYRFHLEEAINRPYEATVDIVTRESASETDAFLGQSATVEWARGESEVQAVHGIVAEVAYIGRNEEQVMVRLVIVPAFALARQDTHYRIFQDMSVLEILKEVLEAFLGPYERALDAGAATRGNQPRDYCVQYGESTFDFACRLLEEEGISYVFTHEGNAEELLLVHENAELPPAPNLDGSSLFPLIVTRPGTAEVESVQTFEPKLSLLPTAARRQDYDFETPIEPLTATVDQPVDDAGYTRRIATAMGRRYLEDDLEVRVTDALEAEQARAHAVRGTANAHSFRAGSTFELERHSKVELEAEWVLRRVVHFGSCPEVIVHGEGEESRYGCRFEVCPVERPVRPLQRTPKPRVQGPQTAIVAGPSGEEIHTDAHGRIMVQFHWEEDSTYDDTSSCWVRVAQSWAGPGWGAQFIPRVGMEVVVNFLEGNPDRPLVTGCVYNGTNAPPFPVPNNKTQSGIKSRSSPGGKGYNLLRFEDAAGAEEVHLHAQKDWNSTVLNNRATSIGADDALAVTGSRTQSVEVDQAETVGGNKTLKVKGQHNEEIGGTQAVVVVQDASYTCQANRTVTVGKNVTETIAGSQQQTIAKTRTLTVAEASHERVGAERQVAVGGLYHEEVGGGRTITAGGAVLVTSAKAGAFQCAEDLTLRADKKLTLDSGDAMTLTAVKKTSINAQDDYVLKGDKMLTFDVKTQIQFKCGSASIALKKNGDILIKGNKVQLKGSGDIVIKGSNVKMN